MEAKPDDGDRPRVRRVGVNFDPLMLVVEVARGRGSRRKVFLHRIKLKTLPEKADPAYVARKLREKYPDVLSVESVSEAQLIRLTKALVERRLPSEERRMDALENSSDVPKLAAPVPKSTPVSSSHAAGGALAPARAPGPAKASAAPDLTTIDLQRVPPSVVVQAKAAMDVAFEANRKRPGEEGYVYDIQVEFGEGSESNEWDEEED